MKPLRPEDKPKFIALSVAIAGFFVYFLLVVVPKMRGGGAGEPTPVETAKAETTTSPTTATTSDIPMGSVDLYAEISEPLPSAPDPFKYFTGGKVALEAENFSTAPMPLHPLPNVKPVANTSGMQFSPLPAPQGQATLPTILLPDVALSGIVLGDPPVAVVQVGDQTLYKQEGDRLQGDIHILKITEAGVILNRGGKNVMLEVGHSVEGNEVKSPSLEVTPAINTTPSQPITPAPVQETPKPAPSPEPKAESPSPVPMAKPMPKPKTQLAKSHKPKRAKKAVVRRSRRSRAIAKRHTPHRKASSVAKRTKATQKKAVRRSTRKPIRVANRR